jgi:subfamily B ATP-binding cassette protein HlyB/CyaB
VAAEPSQISHRLGGAAVDMPEMVRCARSLSLKARIVTKDWSRSTATALPAIAQRNDGSFLVLGKASEDKVLVQDPVSGRPQLMDRAEFEAVSSGKLVAMTRRASPAELTGSIANFGIGNGIDFRNTVVIASALIARTI